MAGAQPPTAWEGCPSQTCGSHKRQRTERSLAEHSPDPKECVLWGVRYCRSALSRGTRSFTPPLRGPWHAGCLEHQHTNAPTRSNSPIRTITLQAHIPHAHPFAVRRLRSPSVRCPSPASRAMTRAFRLHARGRAASFHTPPTCTRAAARPPRSIVTCAPLAHTTTFRAAGPRFCGKDQSPGGHFATGGTEILHRTLWTRCRADALPRAKPQMTKFPARNRMRGTARHCPIASLCHVAESRVTRAVRRPHFGQHTDLPLPHCRITATSSTTTSFTSSPPRGPLQLQGTLLPPRPELHPHHRIHLRPGHPRGCAPPIRRLPAKALVLLPILLLAFPGAVVHQLAPLASLMARGRRSLLADLCIPAHGR